MSAVIRSKNTGQFLMFRADEAAWTHTRTAVVIGWTDDVNKAGNLTELSRCLNRTEVSKIQNNPDSEILEAEFNVTTVVTLKQRNEDYLK